jgi:hypothetical protein
MSCENPAVHIEMADRSGEVKVENEENADVDVDTTAISILDDDAVPTTTMHSNPHWKRLKLSVKASNAFKRSKDGRIGKKNQKKNQNQKKKKKKNQQRRAKRLSIVMKAKRDSAVEQTTTVVNAAAEAGAAEKKEDDDMKMNKVTQVSPPLNFYKE